MTRAGMILGTAAYMAPEQARGKAVDKRADIWAFGAVLFEMLTGTRPFPGDDISHVLARVIERDPDWSALPSTLSPAIGTCLRRCLVKDPRQRIRDMGDVRLALEGAFETAAPQPAVSLESAATRRPLLWTAAFAVALLAAAAFSIPAVRHLRETPPPETRVDIVTPATGQPTSFALSPDGRQVVFVASDDKASRLWLRSLSRTSAQPLAGTEGSSDPFWSPDGQSIGFFAGGALKRLDLAGGAPQTLAPATNGSGGTWNADGVIVFAPNTTSPLLRVSATGGTSVAVTTLGPQQFGHVDPQFLPDGRRFLFTVGNGSPEVRGIYLGRLDGSSPIHLASEVTSGVYAPAGWLLRVRAGSLIAQRLDVERAVLTGEPVTLASGVALEVASGRSAVSVAATGLVAYRTVGSSQRQLTWFDRAGTARGVVGEPDDSLLTPRVSLDGRRVAVHRTVQDNQDLWLIDDARSTRFTFDPARDLFPVWSPDGTQIVFQSSRTGIGSLFHKLTDGTGLEEMLLSPALAVAPMIPTSWSVDGRFLMYTGIDSQTNADLWVLPMSGSPADRKPFVFLRTPFREGYGTFSPDGAMMAAPINVNGATVDPGVPVMLFPTHIYGGGADVQLGRQYDVTTDGRFLVNSLLSEAAAPITLLQNWNPVAKR